MSTILAPLPAVPHPGFDALLAELPAALLPSFKAAKPTLGPLLQSAPYLLELARTHAEWLADALERGADTAFADLIAVVAETGITAEEAELGQTLRIAKGRTALLAAVAETGGVWTTARATEALSDLGAGQKFRSRALCPR
jgi:glutamate-ammonia-ligase adenylyltransferase